MGVYRWIFFIKFSFNITKVLILLSNAKINVFTSTEGLSLKHVLARVTSWRGCRCRGVAFKLLQINFLRYVKVLQTLDCFPVIVHECVISSGGTSGEIHLWNWADVFTKNPKKISSLNIPIE